MDDLASRARTVGHDLPLALVVLVLLEVGFEVAVTEDVLDEGDVVLPLPDGEGRLLLLAGGLSLAFRRLAPVAVVGVTMATCLSYQALQYRPAPLPVAVLVALFTVAIVRRPLICGVAAATYATALVVFFATGATDMDDDQVYVYLVSIAATAMVGYGIALSRARTTLAERQSAELAREHQVRTRAAVEQEQARIAREVHDIVASEVSVIVCQAAAARRNLDRRPEAAAGALASIETVGRDALDGLRRLMALLRSDTPQPEPPAQPGLERLPWLISQLERAGLPVDLTVRGTPRPLPSTVELNAFRIVQEALTNSLKHAGPTRATVTLDYDAEWLGVEVRDEGQGSANGSTLGYGLSNMRQRAAMVGGDLDAGPEARGFRVTARLPAHGGAL